MSFEEAPPKLATVSVAVCDAVRLLVYEAPFPIPRSLAVQVDVGTGVAVPFVWHTSPESLPHTPFRFHVLFQLLKVRPITPPSH
jgi:hypothetical protein